MTAANYNEMIETSLNNINTIYHQSISKLFDDMLAKIAAELVQNITKKFGIIENLDFEVKRYLNPLLGSSQLKFDFNYNKKTIKKSTKKEIPTENQCEARVWKDGLANHRCSCKVFVNGLCKTHAKKELLCSSACEVDANAQRHGLWHGRYNLFQDGIPGVLPYKDKNNILRQRWLSQEMIEIINNDIANKTCFVNQKAKQKYLDLCELKNICDEALDIDELPTIDLPENQLNSHQNSIEGGMDDMIDLPENQLNSHQNSIEGGMDDIIECVEKIDNDGIKYCVDEKTNDIYFMSEHDDEYEYGTIIGRWDGTEALIEAEYIHLIY